LLTVISYNDDADLLRKITGSNCADRTLRMRPYYNTMGLD
jgi:hypothetical protein